MARLPPLEAPFPRAAAAVLDKMNFGMPTPLALFRTLAHYPRVLDRVRTGGLLDKGSLSLRQRELMILRTTARCGAEYEWGVHVRIFAPHTGMTPAEIAATVHGAADDPVWPAEDALIVALADALHETARVDEALYARLETAFSVEQRLELVALAGFYHLISFAIGAFAIDNEAETPRFPPATS
ncbi:MAG: carboxymuconolactone decarboxylase family protein [Reyranellaceae bacterium]